MGIRLVTVIVNKMDTCDYSRAAFSAIEEEIKRFLIQYEVEPTQIIPISARTGENVAKKGGKMPWFQGPTLLEALDGFITDESTDRRLRFPVQDVYKRNGENIAVGRIETGTITRGQQVTVFPGASPCRISRIVKYDEDGITVSRSGECIGLIVEGAELRRGQVLMNDAHAIVGDSLTARIFWLLNDSYTAGSPLTWKLATQSVPHHR
jgi:sulfate adenylyltransferase subunit 1 (EFTu-like GTPase family)